MNIGLDEIRINLREIRAQIADAAVVAGTVANSVRIIAVTKTLPIETVRTAALAGLDEFGENYVQEILTKLASGVDLVKWHFIGHLQTNKVAPIIGQVALIQSVDRVKLAKKISDTALDMGVVQDILLQVHLGDEVSKGGVAIDQLERLYDDVREMPGIRVQGLMGMAPLTDIDGRPADPKPYFDSLRQLYDKLPGESRKILSMGMSGDYIAAVESGSNMVRIGSALFGPRLRPPEAVI